MAVNPARFQGGSSGQWRVTAQRTVAGAPLPEAPFVTMRASLEAADDPAFWTLRGTNGHVRYSPDSARAALIPIRKTAAWWAMAQDERRHVMEAESHHIAQSVAYLPAIARRLYHCRDLVEPFDFLTWFEFAPQDESLFDQLVAKLRSTPEWTYVDREVDIRLERV
jgi:hypothetical protein